MPEFNIQTPLPQEILRVRTWRGGRSRVAVRAGLRVRVNGGYIPYAVRQENTGLRDGNIRTPTGYFWPVYAFRILRGFDIELAYRLYRWHQLPGRQQP